jgi:alpha-glucosidase
MKFPACILLLFCLISQTYAAGPSWKVTSPNRQLVVTVYNERGNLSYEVSFNKVLAIGRSPLGIDREDQQFSSRMRFVSMTNVVIDEPYTLLVGKRLQNRNHANEMTLSFRNPNRKRIDLIIRAYDDGMAYRYLFPENDQHNRKMQREYSGFLISGDAKAWIQPYDMNVRKKPCYETYYENGIMPGSPSPNQAGWAFPALFSTEGLWVLITEAGLDQTYCATHLEDKAGNGLYTIRFPEQEEVTSDTDGHPVSTLPWYTPWRAAIIGSELNAIEESNLVTDLNPSSEISDTSWIKPGRASWSWWSDGATTREYRVQKEYVDFNAAMGWEYVLIDAGWPQMVGGTMKDLVHYANSKGVGIFLWYHSGMGREKDTLSMANVMAFPEERAKEFQKIKDWGVKGVKVDFFDSDKQPVIKRYFDILKDAGKYKIMVNFHGSTLPRGWERTYPYLMSMESVKGAEGYGRQDFCDKAPVHNTILPFTRNVVGPMDYTPVTFTNKREAIRQTTFGHELALSLVFESGIFHFADRCNAYLLMPGYANNFLKKVPVVWDESRLVAGMPGEYVVLARRKGTDWYIGGINGLDNPLKLSLDLSFLNQSKKLKVITDDTSGVGFSEKDISVTGGSANIELAPRGGFVSTVE